jgi:hypothetical protein
MMGNRYSITEALREAEHHITHLMGHRLHGWHYNTWDESRRAWWVGNSQPFDKAQSDRRACRVGIAGRLYALRHGLDEETAAEIQFSCEYEADSRRDESDVAIIRHALEKVADRKVAAE